MKYISNDGKCVSDRKEDVIKYELEFQRERAKEIAAKTAKVDADKKKVEKEKKDKDNYNNDLKDLESTVRVVNDILHRNKLLRDTKRVVVVNGCLVIEDVVTIKFGNIKDSKCDKFDKNTANECMKMLQLFGFLNLN